MLSQPIHPNLFTWPAQQPQLLGGRCPHCGEISFPVQQACRQCSHADSEMIELGNRGILWTWTIQGFLPKAPYASGETAETFKPYGVGYVELPVGIRIESRLTLADPEKLTIGMPMQLVIEPFNVDADGCQKVHFAFAPLEAD